MYCGQVVKGVRLVITTLLVQAQAVAIFFLFHLSAVDVVYLTQEYESYVSAIKLQVDVAPN